MNQPPPTDAVTNRQASAPADPELTADYLPSHAAATIPTAVAERYEIVRLHARGGLGQVLLAHDRELKREVAVKEIRAEHADDESKRQRFVREAELTGSLEHPGIVPIYGSGRYADGRPYYAMRLLRGQTLQEAIADFHRVKHSERQQLIELRRLLGRFLAVCNTIAFAHSRGVLHRDLKPANIMLGPFGETLVVDWGLAKVIGTVDVPGTDSATPEASATAELTLPGAAVGTPAYMSPEQAAGDHELVGPHSDIYSLGATLYCLLTGQAPFKGAPAAELLQRVRAGAIVSPLRVQGWVPPPLAAICLKAMALDPSARYASALALAEELESWLADEPVGAYGQPLFARLTRWLRHHTLLVTVVGVFVALALLLLPFVLFLVAVLTADRPEL